MSRGHEDGEKPQDIGDDVLTQHALCEQSAAACNLRASLASQPVDTLSEQQGRSQRLENVEKGRGVSPPTYSRRPFRLMR